MNSFVTPKLLKLVFQCTSVSVAPLSLKAFIYGAPKYPDVKMNFARTNETFGYEYLLESQSRGVLESIADLYDESEEPYVTLARDKPYSTSNKKASKSVSSPPENLLVPIQPAPLTTSRDISVDTQPAFVPCH